MSRLRILPSIAFFCTFCCLPVLRAQVSNIAPRVAGPVDDASRVTPGGSFTVLAQPQFDRGEASPTVEFHNVRLVIHRSQQQEAALDTFMAEQLDRHSPNFHHWLTPDQFNKLYGLADSDVAAIELWLQSHGLKVESATATDIAFSGAVPEIEEALHTSIHSFVTPSGNQFYSNTTEPSIPAAFSSVISGVAFLNTLQPRSYAIHGPSGKYDPQTHKLAPANASAVHAQPDLTVNGRFLYMVPADAATIYDTPNSYNAAFSTGISYNGAGVTIGIGGDSAIKTSTVVDYRTRFLNGDTNAPTVIDLGAPTNPAQVNGDEDEAYLDNEIAGGLAPGAAIDFYVSNQATTDGIYDDIPRMISDNTVDIFSLSFGYCELYLGTETNAMVAGWWQQAASQGITVVVSTGDSGSAGCDNQDTEQTASAGLNVSGFSSTPYNVAVGGTDFHGLIGGFSNYVNSNSSSTNSYRSALSYIPESTWNDSTTSNGAINRNVPEIGLLNTGENDIIAGAGGVSNCSVNTTTYGNAGVMTAGTCTSGYAKPAWQTGTGVPADGARDVPDVSLPAANGFYEATWLVCTDDVPQGGSFAENCSTHNGGTFYYAGIGGTSASAPAFAGILALVVQANGGRIGLDGAKFLYDIYNSANGVAAFHDITQGNNSVLCAEGTPDCTVPVTGGNFESGYNTGPGYDLATGLGSVDATKLIAGYAALSGGSGGGGGGGGGAITPTVTVSPASSSIVVTQSLSVTVTVSGGTGDPTPSGTIALTSGSYSGSSPLVSGSATIIVPANSLAAGSDTLSAAYSGDSNYLATTGTSPVTVTSGAPSGTYSLSASAPSAVNAGGTATSTITVSSANGYSGTITVACTLASAPSNGSDPATCAVASADTAMLGSSNTSGTVTVTVSTTAASASSLNRRGVSGWLGAGGGAALALVIFFGIPAQRRRWRNMLGLLVVAAVLGTLSACSAGGGSNGSGGGGGGGTSNPGTTSGNYTFTVTGTGNPGGGGPYTTTFNVTVN